MTEAEAASQYDAGPDLKPVAPEALLEALAIRGLGPTTIRRLFTRFDSLEAARHAGDEELLAIGLKRQGVQALRQRRCEYDPGKEMEKARRLGIRLIPFTSHEYPTALRNHESSPPLLYVKGEIIERDSVALAVVGARRASLYGKMQAERLAFELAQAGFTIVGGMARGIDAAGHEGALKAGGRTIGVLGNGLATVYPKENEALAERIAAHGALISELPLDTAPTASNFPPRNRIIAGLGLGVLVVEASRMSGALITARLAGEMGKEVFAVPGDVGRPQSRGTHQLIRDGAKLVETIEDIIEELGPLAQPVRMSEKEQAYSVADARALTLNPQERAAYDLLDSSPKSIDQITRESNLSAANVASTLMVLEMKRLAVQMPGKLYVRAGSFQR